MDCSLPSSSVHGILQARILEWVAISFSRDLPDPGIEPRFPTLEADALTSEPRTFISSQICLLLLLGVLLFLLSYPNLLASKMFHFSDPHPPSFSLLSQWVDSKVCPQNFLPVSLLSVMPSQSYASCGKSKYRKMTTCTLMLVRMSSLYPTKCLPRGSLKGT